MNRKELKFENHSTTDTYNYRASNGQTWTIEFVDDVFFRAQFGLRGNYTREDWKSLGIFANEIEQLCKKHAKSVMMPTEGGDPKIVFTGRVGIKTPQGWPEIRGNHGEPVVPSILSRVPLNETSDEEEQWQDLELKHNIRNEINND